jgi:hypothetical protein
MRLGALKAMNIIISWDTTLCSLVHVYRRFGGECCFPFYGKRANRYSSILKMAPGIFSEILVNIQHTTKCHRLEDNNLHIQL